jgi:antitoxin (DNA-binding transcriptional repressor) of toxin-antitoxin stability system
MKTTSISKTRIIPITELRRNFGEITKRLAEIDSLILTKGGEPFATLKAAPEAKEKLLRSVAGVWKNTSLDDDKIWKEAAKKKSRNAKIVL